VGCWGGFCEGKRKLKKTLGPIPRNYFLGRKLIRGRVFPSSRSVRKMCKLFHRQETVSEGACLLEKAYQSEGEGR